MIPKNLVFICAQPHADYFAWQVEVLLTNFREKGITGAQILVYYPKNEPLNPVWQKLINKYKESKFFFYSDEGDGVDVNFYIPQLRPHILKQHFRIFENDFKDKIFFYHDCDILFNYLPDFSVLCNDDICWESNTSGYLDYTYLSGKEAQGKISPGEVVDELAKIGGISSEIIKKYDKKSGGAQYVLKDIDHTFWQEVEDICLKVRRYLMIDINTKYFPSESDGFQSWCADMWAVNFVLWEREKITDVTSLLDFSWATDHIDTFYKKPIYHNAGATSKSKGLFYKAAWINRNPLGRRFAVSKNFASYKYVEAMYKVK